MTALRTPPGRAAHRWLVHRLGVARRSADMLDRRHHLLRVELRRLDAAAGEARAGFETALRDAEVWVQRALVAGGIDQLRIVAAHLPSSASLTTTWDRLLGVEVCTQQRCDVPDAPRASRTGLTSALDVSAARYSTALVAAGVDAAARQSRDAVAADLGLTARRLRGLQRRSIPRLEAALAELETRLDETERDEAVRARWAGVGGRRATR
jgi:vacuolar-type H+-ATPase subunit D/Vma8